MRVLKLLIPLLLFSITKSNAQYFGQNKPKYESFDFEVHQCEHFDIYAYLKNKEKVKEIAQYSEWWYQLHQAVLQDTFTSRNPLIIYNNHADFQQTNAISGQISAGTGGVTEGLKNRVVMPIAATNQQTHHVLGHELVHAFQYHMVINGDSTSLKSLANLPLWMVEGLAEYLSIGRVDAHTAMWMRDAVIQKDVPSIKDLNSGRYFPYRYGQAFWSFVAGKYGDEIIEPLFMNTAKYGLELGIKKSTGISSKELSELWQESVNSHYKGIMGDRMSVKIGRPILTDKNAGRMNVSPVLSPNGKYVIFFSEKDLFSLDLYLADARNGKIIRKIASQGSKNHIDDFSAIESAGTWSPNGKEFAYVVVSKGNSKLIIVDVENGKIKNEIALEKIPSFNNPAWSPDGKSILVTGQVDGQSDLFLINVKTKRVKQLTDDVYSEIQPSWSAQGDKVVFASDRLSMGRGRTNGRLAFNLSELNMADGKIKDFDFFPGADNLNPKYDQHGNIFFLSDRDGYRNIYQYQITGDSLFQRSDFLTGVSGITKYSPAISTAIKADRLAFSLYDKGRYRIYQSQTKKLLRQAVDRNEVDFTAANLPMMNGGKTDIVNDNLNKLGRLKKLQDEDIKSTAYKKKFKLDYLSGGGGVGLGGGAFGTSPALAGGVTGFFGDVLGDNQLLAGLSLNGELIDAGGQVTYINRKHRIAWGAKLGHLPYRSGRSYFPVRDTIQLSDDAGIPVLNYPTDLVRIFEDQVGVFAHFPISKQQRIEAGITGSLYSYRVDRYNNYYDGFGRLIQQDRERLDAPPGFGLQSFDAAYVGDNAVFGIASPLKGYRFRLGAQQYFGRWNFQSVTLDFRKYIRLKPVTIAARLMHYGRYGKDAKELPVLFLGGQGNVHGYAFNTIDQNGLDNLIGNKLLVANLEFRLPLTGPERLAMMKSKFLFTELAAFFDVGTAFNNFSDFQAGQNDLALRKPVLSTGVSLRVNLFGALIVEPYYAFQLSTQERRGVFGFNFIPGW